MIGFKKEIAKSPNKYDKIQKKHSKKNLINSRFRALNDQAKFKL